jgi:hypothetical protein
MNPANLDLGCMTHAIFEDTAAPVDRLNRLAVLPLTGLLLALAGLFLLVIIGRGVGAT